MLGRYLPVMIGSDIPSDDDHWRCYSLLLSIIQYLFAPSLFEDDLALLQEKLQQHHILFTTLYPSQSVIPKMHFILHTPRLIYEYVSIMGLYCMIGILWNRFGPLVHLWTMRFEAKHKYLKQLTGTIGNYNINLPHTLAMRHQFLQCYLRLGDSISSPLEIGKGITNST